MVDYSGTGYCAPAIMANAFLMISKHACKRREVSSFATEEKRCEIGIAKHPAVCSDTSNLSHPRATHRVEDDAVKAAKGGRYSGTQLDMVVLELRSSIQELVCLTANHLELPQWHDTDDMLYPPYE